MAQSFRQFYIVFVFMVRSVRALIMGINAIVSLGL